jgi:hypothetical protein
MTNDNAIFLLDGCIRSFKDDNSINVSDNGELFELFSVYNITKEIGLSIQELYDSIVDGPSDGGIDSLVICINDKYIYDLDELIDIKITQNTVIKVYVIQSKHSKNFEEGPINNLYVSLDVIFDFTYDEKYLLSRFNKDVVEKIKLFRNLWERSAVKRAKIYVNCFYVSRGSVDNLNSIIISKRDQLLSNSRTKLLGVEFDFDFMGSNELLNLYNKAESYVLPLRFKELPTSIAFKDNPEIGYIGMITLEDYFSFITNEYGRENIFENNIRFYQGDVDVNERILETLEDDEVRDFWWLNNGITIIASDYTPHPKILHLKDPQIVNGLQTSFVINEYFRSNKDRDIDKERSILVKVIISDNKETIDKIIFATNSQTPITPALLHATDDIQRKLEQFFLDKGYYYDRRKNYYRRKNKPLNRIFDIQYTAQCVQAILNFDPARARSKPTSLIKDESTYKSIFKDELDYSVYLNCCLIHRAIVEHIKIAKKYTDDDEIKGVFSDIHKNFTFHLARIIPSLIYKNANYNHIDLSKINIDDINETLIMNSIELLIKYINEYMKINSSENIINGHNLLFE